MSSQPTVTKRQLIHDLEIVLSIPQIPDPHAKIGPELARQEATNLFDAGGSITTERMAELNALQVSRLQPVRGHSVMQRMPPGAPGQFHGRFLKEMERLVKLLDKAYATFNFDFARRMLFVDEAILEGATPKITGKDRYGIKWMIKWGD